VEVVREVTVELRTPLTSMESVTRQLFRDLMPFMRRTDGIALKGFNVQRDVVIAHVEIIRPLERKA
jgi:signal transduction histidine kinase